MSVDYAAEYNNRARVPEHPRIIEAWHRDAAAYRTERPDAVLGLAYGPRERMRYDWFPAGPDAPVALFLHGGYWMAFEGSVFSHMARGANLNGVSVAIATYDLAPHVSVATIVDQMRALVRVLHGSQRRAVTVFGHSAGGHLAAMLAADAGLTDASGPMVAAAMPVSGLFDLAPLLETPLNATLGLDADSAAALSPLGLRPRSGLPVVAVVGGEESSEYLRQSRSLVETWGLAGARTELIIAPGDNHFTVIAPFADPASRLSQTLARLCLAP